MVILKAGENAVLMVSATNSVRVGLIILDCKRACKKIADLLYFLYIYIRKLESLNSR